MKDGIAKRIDKRFTGDGIAYRADYHKGRIVEVNSKKSEGKLFSMPFDRDEYPRQYAAARVVRDGRSFFSRYPDKDPRVNQDGIKNFNISGSLLAVPVHLRTGLLPLVAGVLVLWAKEENLSEETVEPLKQEFERAARLTIVPFKTTGS